MEYLATCRYSNDSRDEVLAPRSWARQAQTFAVGDGGAGVTGPEGAMVLRTASLCWVLVDIVMLLAIVMGNVLTILAVRLSRRLRNVASNRLIASLALSDLVVGLSLLYHLFFFLSTSLGSHKATCLLRFVLLICGCCASFLNLTAIAVDRYLSIVHPLKYPEYVTEKLVSATIGFNWLCALLLSSSILFWNNYDCEAPNDCELVTVVPRYLIAAVMTPFFVTVWLSIILLYWRIWKEAKSHAQRWKMTGFLNFDSSHWKSIQVVLLILGCFSICWLPYVILAVTQVINPRRQLSPTVYRVMFSIAMGNSCVNPIIYAWKNPSFRKAFHRLLRLRSPNHNDYNSSFKNYLRKQSELSKRELDEAAIPPTVAPAPGTASPATTSTSQRFSQCTAC